LYSEPYILVAPLVSAERHGWHIEGGFTTLGQREIPANIERLSRTSHGNLVSASNEADFINGAVLSVKGGLTL